MREVPRERKWICRKTGADWHDLGASARHGEESGYKMFHYAFPLQFKYNSHLYFLYNIGEESVFKN